MVLFYEFSDIGQEARLVFGGERATLTRTQDIRFKKRGSFNLCLHKSVAA